MFKVLSVNQIFHFQRICICPSFGIVMQNTLKVYVCTWTMRWFFHAEYFPSGMLMKKPRGPILMYVFCFFAWKNLRNIYMGNITFQVLGMWCSTLWKWYVVPLEIEFCLHANRFQSALHIKVWIFPSVLHYSFRRFSRWWNVCKCTVEEGNSERFFT